MYPSIGLKTFGPSPAIGWLLALLCPLALGACRSAPPVATADCFGVPRAEIAQELDRVLRAWYPRIIDTINGGYWTNFEYDWSRSAEQPKMLVTQARGLWTAARAAQEFPDSVVFRQAADHGYRFLTERMWDPRRGGFFQHYSDRDLPAAANTHKMAYGNAFALYALSEYARVNPDPAVKTWVEKAFDWLETAAYDPMHGGYFNILLPEHVTDSSYIASLGWGDPRWKDQNSSIHLLEALTAMYRVVPTPRVAERLREMLTLVRDTMVQEGGYLQLNFTHDWQPISFRDSTRAFIMAHLNYDHKSFGHDIETGYLLIEASEVLHGGRVDERTLTVAKQLVDHTLQYGFADDYYGLYDRGYTFAGQTGVEIVNRRKTWWSQAEAWHALALMAIHFPNDSRYRTACRAMWHYMQRELIDHQYGEWYNDGLDETPASRTSRKAHPWKGAYHNGRALMQVLGYCRA